MYQANPSCMASISLNGTRRLPIEERIELPPELRKRGRRRRKEGSIPTVISLPDGKRPGNDQDVSCDASVQSGQSQRSYDSSKRSWKTRSVKSSSPKSLTGRTPRNLNGRCSSRHSTASSCSSFRSTRSDYHFSLAEAREAILKPASNEASTTKPLPDDTLANFMNAANAQAPSNKLAPILKHGGNPTEPNEETGLDSMVDLAYLLANARAKPVAHSDEIVCIPAEEN